MIKARDLIPEIENWTTPAMTALWACIDAALDHRYRQGYEDGESSGHADWVLALDELPFDVSKPQDVIDAFNEHSPPQPK